MLIDQGVQLCATVRKFDALEKLNHNQKLDGLVLIVGVSPDNKLDIRINMPASMEVRLTRWITEVFKADILDT